MSLSNPSGLHLLIAGILIWFLGAVLGILVPGLAPIAGVVILLGQVIAAIGVILLIVNIIRGAV
jgi:hypothetical protein